MKKRIYTKQTKRKIRPVFSFLLVIIIIYSTFKTLDQSKIEMSDKELVMFLLKRTKLIESNDNTIKKVKSLINIIETNPDKLLLTTASNLIKEEKQQEVLPAEKTDDQPSIAPLIYIYNSHQTEEYSASTFLEFSINPTVMMANYILEETFNNNNYKTVVEEQSIKDILNANNWKYSSSYKASRILMETKKQENPTLKYYIDVHRDSLTKDRTTVQINDKSYAKILFLIGLENPDYEENLKFTNEINNVINIKYPNLSKGIYKKSGPGVNGVYNQDFSPYAILIEMGGYENTPEEVMNSTLAFAECYMEVISTYENKRTS